MPEDRIKNSVRPQPTGITRPSQNDAGRAQGGPSHRTLDNAVKNDALQRPLRKWRDRGKGITFQYFVDLTRISNRIRHGQAMTLRAHGQDWLHTPDELKTSLNLTVDGLLKDPKHDLRSALEGNYRNDKGAKFLFKSYRHLLSTIQQYADRSATYKDVEARHRGFTNLKLFLAHGGDLHSTSRRNKLQRTVAMIPENVLKNASKTVTYKDYATADHLKQEKGKLPLLSFHGYKATGSWFGMDKKSQVYREKLRAITASALLLGREDEAVEKTLKVKELLHQINKLPNMGKGGRKEDVVDRILKSLETLDNPDALINELNFELQRHKLAQKFNIDANIGKTGLADEADQDSANVGKELQKLDGVPNRLTVIEHLNTKFDARADGYTLDQPHNLLDDLRFITQPGDPVANVLKSHQGDGEAAQNAIYTWADLMTKRGSAVRDGIHLEVQRIEQSNDSKASADVYLRVAQAFADTDKSDLSVDDQSTLLLSLLRDLSAPPSIKPGAGGLGNDIKDDINNDNDPGVRTESDRPRNEPRIDPRDTGDIPVVDIYREDDVFGDF